MQPLSFFALVPLALGSFIQRSQPKPLTNITIFDPPSDYNVPRTLYARNVELPNGDLLATWENYSPEPPLVYFPIYKSSDSGKTWREFSRVHDQVNDWGLRYQPFLYYLPERIGNFPAGTLLLAGNSIPTNLSYTRIDLYASHDQGLNWEFVSRVASGGEAEPDNGLTPIWEPFLLAHEGRLICYYSDQRANATHGQKLVHQVSADLKHWGAVVNDAEYPTYTDRPGMTTVAQLPNGLWIMTYEYGSFFNTSDYSFPVYFRLSKNPENFGEVEGQRIVVNDGTQPASSPYVTWTPYGGPNGTIIVSCGTLSSVFINQALGEGEWTEVSTPEGTSYTRSLRIFEQDPRFLLINGAGVLGGEDNSVTASVVDLEKALPRDRKQ
ncbi:hypothetical protein N7474_007426 [Penicillium riverlandense]|uniref:uncharacterized protein n=1 Tax=Penicillium riverlandense TaxID=1903569 RepID=UPI00254829D3|nr:uncharacterized protein N7474_007426 [Penicillium riverlandense]KAJ5815649.1 hypothetical protein N7474_007426 [Penicillium riverlandense]